MKHRKKHRRHRRAHKNPMTKKTTALVVVGTSIAAVVGLAYFLYWKSQQPAPQLPAAGAAPR